MSLFPEDKEDDGGILRKSANVGYRFKIIVRINALDFGLVILLSLKSLVHKARLVIECCAGSKLGAVSVDNALVIEGNLQLDAVIGIMLILQAEITENGIAAIEQINSGCFAGSILSNESDRVKYIKLIGNGLQLILFVFRCLLDFAIKSMAKLSQQFLKLLATTRRSFMFKHLHK